VRESDFEAQAARAVEHLRREPIAWLRAYESATELRWPDEAWLAPSSGWTLFASGRFFEITLVKGRVTQRSPPEGEAWVRGEIAGALRYQGEEPARRQARMEELRLQLGDEGMARVQRQKEESDAAEAAYWARLGAAPPPRRFEPDFALVRIPYRVRDEIRRKTDPNELPKLLATCRITFVGQGATDMPVVRDGFGPVDPRGEPERWKEESARFQALLAELEPFRKIEFAEGSIEVD
jgi:hypothetical protein